MPVSEKEIIERLPDWIAEKKTSFLFGSGTSAPGMPLMNMFPGKKDGSTDVDGLMYEIINPDSTCKCNGWFRVGLF